MDHAGDITEHLAPALQAAGFPVYDNQDTATREHRELVTQGRDTGIFYRITIDEIHPTGDDYELYLPTYGASA